MSRYLRRLTIPIVISVMLLTMVHGHLAAALSFDNGIVHYWSVNATSVTWYIRPLRIEINGSAYVLLVNATVVKGVERVPYYDELAGCVCRNAPPIVFGNVTGVVGRVRFDKLSGLKYTSKVLGFIAPRDVLPVYNAVLRVAEVLAEKGFYTPWPPLYVPLATGFAAHVDRVKVRGPVSLRVYFALESMRKMINGSAFAESSSLSYSLLDPREVLKACGLVRYSSWEFVRPIPQVYVPYGLDAIVVKEDGRVSVYLVEVHVFRGAILVDPEDRNRVAGIYGDAYIVYRVGGEGGAISVDDVRCLGSYLSVKVETRDGKVLGVYSVNKSLELPVTVYEARDVRVALGDAALLVAYKGRSIAIPGLYGTRGKFTRIEGVLPIGTILYIDADRGSLAALLVYNDGTIALIRGTVGEYHTSIVYRGARLNIYPPEVYSAIIDSDLDGRIDSIYLRVDDAKSWLFSLLVRFDAKPYQLLDRDRDGFIDTMVVDGVEKRVHLEVLPPCRVIRVTYEVNGKAVDLRRFIGILYSLYSEGYRDAAEYVAKLWMTPGLRWLASRVYEAIFSNGSYYMQTRFAKSGVMLPRQEYIRAAFEGADRLLAVLKIPTVPLLAWSRDNALYNLMRIIGRALGIDPQKSSYIEFLGACGYEIISNSSSALCTCLTRIAYKAYSKTPYSIRACSECKWNISDVLEPGFADKVLKYGLLAACEKLVQHGEGVEQCSRLLSTVVGKYDEYLERVRSMLRKVVDYYQMLSNNTILLDAVRSWSRTKDLAARLSEIIADCSGQRVVCMSLYYTLGRAYTSLETLRMEGRASIVEVENLRYIVDTLKSVTPARQPCSLLYTRLRMLQSSLERLAKSYYTVLDEKISKLNCMHLSIAYQGDSIRVVCEDNGKVVTFPRSLLRGKAANVPTTHTTTRMVHRESMTVHTVSRSAASTTGMGVGVARGGAGVAQGTPIAERGGGGAGGLLWLGVVAAVVAVLAGTLVAFKRR